MVNRVLSQLYQGFHKIILNQERLKSCRHKKTVLNLNCRETNLKHGLFFMVHNRPPVGQSQITKTGNDNPQSAVIEYLYNTPLPDGVEIPLATVSERDSVWDTHGTQSAIIEGIYKLAKASEFERYSESV